MEKITGESSDDFAYTSAPTTSSFADTSAGATGAAGTTDVADTTGTVT
jgi:hypothetical protein